MRAPALFMQQIEPAVLGLRPASFTWCRARPLSVRSSTATTAPVAALASASARSRSSRRATSNAEVGAIACEAGACWSLRPTPLEAFGDERDARGHPDDLQNSESLLST